MIVHFLHRSALELGSEAQGPAAAGLVSPMVRGASPPNAGPLQHSRIAGDGQPKFGDGRGISSGSHIDGLLSRERIFVIPAAPGDYFSCCSHRTSIDTASSVEQFVACQYDERAGARDGRAQTNPCHVVSSASRVRAFRNSIAAPCDRPRGDLWPYDSAVPMVTGETFPCKAMRALMQRAMPFTAVEGIIVSVLFCIRRLISHVLTNALWLGL